MDYQFEQLGPDRFQEFCQALLIREYPYTQCFPIGQPDGGRDAISPFLLENDTTKELIVFQVKFSRKPHAETDPHKWLLEKIKDELPKIKNLIDNGAKKYILLTNIPGTAHLDNGSIDKLNKMVADTLNIPFQCWWRDDLNRRLDSAWNLKWTYIELMSGIDVLHYMYQTSSLEEKERRETAMRNFLITQYSEDEEVRFKQIALTNKLIGLFIDVPIKIPRNSHQTTSENFSPKNALRTDFFENELKVSDTNPVGAAQLLLHPKTSKILPQIVLEGAPGQGKSTIAQYICQVYRVYILQKWEELARIPEHLKPKSLRIPFKVDLRQLATWFQKQNPFSTEDGDLVPEEWQKTLESFLAFQIKNFSGGFNFSIVDLYAIAKFSPLLLVLDGLDEIANISTREEVIKGVNTGILRLGNHCTSLQVVITSRPTAFINSQGFPEDNYPHYELSSITKQQIHEYAEKWIEEQKLTIRQIKEIKEVLQSKIEQPHIKDLSTNMMQLAILLSLIKAFGSSLPDKRTALYDKYIEYFFNREAEKNDTIHKYRDLIIDIHRYVAWVLHAEAEIGKERGNISREKLLQLLRDYLIEEKNDPSIAEELLKGVVDRIVALVSRIEGSYEFEVQPLREYFAAKYLYDTAPHSPPGFEHKGTKPDRFDAIAKNFYWLNVTRFLAGCFSKGELSALADSLEDLATTENYRNTNHPTVLAAMLLSDWVFTQSQRVTQRVLKIILDSLTSKSFVTEYSINVNESRAFSLSDNSGRRELLRTCFNLLENEQKIDYAAELCHLINENADMQEILGEWHSRIMASTSSKRTQWLKYGLRLGVLQRCTKEDIEKILSDEPNNLERLEVLVRSGQASYCETDPFRCDLVVQEAFKRNFSNPNNVNPNESILTNFCYLMNFPFLNPISISTRKDQSLIQRLPQSIRNSLMFTYTSDIVSDNIILSKCHKSSNIIYDFYKLRPIDWISTFEPLNDLVDELRSIWGEQWAFFHLAGVVYSILAKDTSPTPLIDFNVLDHSKSLCLRVISLKPVRGDIEWWKKQLIVENELEAAFISLLLLTRASSNVILSLYKEINNLFNSLSTAMCYQLFRSVKLISHRMRTLSDIESLEGIFSERSLVLLSTKIRAGKELLFKFYTKYFLNYQGDDPIVLEFCQTNAVAYASANQHHWPQALKVVAKSYNFGLISDAFYSIIMNSQHEDNYLPIEIAKKITEDARSYPRFLVKDAGRLYKNHIATHLTPVIKVAQDEGWFINP